MRRRYKTQLLAAIGLLLMTVGIKIKSMGWPENCNERICRDLIKKGRPMTTIDQTAFARLDSESRLFNGVHKGPTKVPGRFGFREIYADQVMTVSEEGGTSFPFLVAYLHSFGHLQMFVDVLGDALSPEGVYIMFCDNIDFSKKYTVQIKGLTFYILPIEEATVYNETLELLYLEKTELKKLDTAGKLDTVANAGVKFKATYPSISYEEGLSLMKPLRNRNANRPV
jgi:hypothetical protein